ncbi:MAG: hypothetical protein ACREB9_07595 [Thermoplasmata archaeon]
MPETLLDLILDRAKLRDQLIEAARKELRHHVVDRTLKNVVIPRVDEVVGRARRR